MNSALKARQKHATRGTAKGNSLKLKNKKVAGSISKIKRDATPKKRNKK